MQRTKTPLGEKTTVNRSRSTKTVGTEIIRHKLWNYGYYGFEKINIKSWQVTEYYEE